MFYKEKITEQDENRRKEIQRWIKDNIGKDEEMARLFKDEIDRYIATEFFNPDKRIPLAEIFP